MPERNMGCIEWRGWKRATDCIHSGADSGIDRAGYDLYGADSDGGSYGFI